jgi:DNA (cytosine-5)-methyltransferase 3A
MKVDNYYASEIDKYAIQVTMANYPNTIQLGSVVDVDVSKLEKIDLLIGGSPCQSFSFAGKRKGMSTKDSVEILTLEHYLELKSQNFEFEGQSYLFWEYMRVLTDIRKYNPDVKFLLENVIMGEKWQKILTQAIGINPIEINSALLSAQNRRRLYWTNIGAEQDGLFGDLKCMIPQPKDKGILLKDILESEVGDKYFLSEKRIAYFNRKIKKGFLQKICSDINGKSECLLASMYKQMQGFCVASRGRNPSNPKSREAGLETEQMLEPRLDGKTNCLTSVQKDNLYYEKERIRCFTEIECERLQTIKPNYTAHVSSTQRLKMIGNGWTVEVIAHIFSFLKP